MYYFKLQNLNPIMLLEANYQQPFSHLTNMTMFLWWIWIIADQRLNFLVSAFWGVLMVVRFNPSCLTLYQHPHHSVCFSKQVSVKSSYGRHMKRGGISRPQIEFPSPLGNGEGLRVFVVSDLHTDYAENLNWVKCLVMLLRHMTCLLWQCLSWKKDLNMCSMCLEIMTFGAVARDKNM